MKHGAWWDYYRWRNLQSKTIKQIFFFALVIKISAKNQNVHSTNIWHWIFTLEAADAFLRHLYSEMRFIKYIIQTAASMISVDWGVETHNAAKACWFTDLFLWHYTMRPQTFWVGNGIFLPDITLSNVTCRDPAKKWTQTCATHPQNCCSSVSFRDSTAYPPHFTHTHASSARACRFAFVVCGSALWKLGHIQPEWLHHRINSVKHLPRLSLFVPRKDLSAALAHIAHSLLLAAPPITLLMSSLFARWL